MAFNQEELPERCSSSELPGATGDISLLKVLYYMCCSFFYLHFVDCHHVLLLTLTHSLGFVPANHRHLSLSIFDQLCDWRWSRLLGKNVKVHSPFTRIFPNRNILHIGGVKFSNNFCVAETVSGFGIFFWKFKR